MEGSNDSSEGNNPSHCKTKSINNLGCIDLCCHLFVFEMAELTLTNKTYY